MCKDHELGPSLCYVSIYLAVNARVSDDEMGLRWIVREAEFVSLVGKCSELGQSSLSWQKFYIPSNRWVKVNGQMGESGNVKLSRT